MASENSAVDVPITKGIEERMKDLGIEDKTQATMEKEDDAATLPAHKEDENEEGKQKKESDSEDKSVTDKTEMEEGKEKKESDVQEKSVSDKIEEKKTEKDEDFKDIEEEEVAVPSVDQRSYGGNEEKKEEVPATVVHQIHHKEENPSQGILYTVGTKVLSTASTIKDAIVGKSK